MANVMLHFAPLMPAWAIACVTLCLLAVLAHGSRLLVRNRVPRRWIGLLGGLRVAVIAVFAICMLQPVISFRTTEERLPEMAVLVDTSRSMACADVAGAGSRLEAARAAVGRGPLAAALEKRFRLRFFAFDRRLRPIGEADLGSVRPTGETTRLADCLEAVCSLAGQAAPLDAADRGRLARVLVVGDGVDRGGADPAAVAERLGVTVDTLAVGGSGGAGDEPRVVVSSVQAPRRVLLGAETEFGVVIRRDGDDDAPRVLALTEGSRTLATEDVSFRAGERQRTIRMPHRPGEAGVHEYEIRLAPQGPDGSPAAAVPFRVSVQVVDKKHEVLLMEDTWRWEFKFLRRIFEDDPNFSFTALLSRPGGSVVQMGESDRRVSVAGMPATRAELDWFDIYVLGDVRPDRWPRGMASALASLVRDEGKSLVVVAGPNIAELAATPDLAALLPVEVTRESGTPLEGPVEVRVSRDGLATPFFANPPAAAGPATPADGKAPLVPGGLPPLDQIYPPLRKRPAATVLVEATKQANASGPLIVMAEHAVGRGRVLYIGTDTLWKWQTIAGADDAGNTPFMIFWQQALRALTPARTFAGGAALYVTPERTRYEAGQRIVVRAEVRSDRPLVAPQIRASVIAPTTQARGAAATTGTAATTSASAPGADGPGEPLPLAFTADPANPDTFVAAFEAGEAGQHRLAVAVIAEGRATAEVTTAIDVEPQGVESDRAPADAAALARLAVATGGRVIDPADPRTFPAVDDSSAGLVERTVSFDLWNDYILMLLLCVLLGVDWGIRLLKGFV